MDKLFRYDREMMPTVFDIKRSEQFNLVATTVLDGYLTAKQATNYLAKDYLGSVPEEFKEWFIADLEQSLTEHASDLKESIEAEVVKNRKVVGSLLVKHPKWKLGFVYVITTKSMPDIVKVGYTKKSPEKRAKGLANTGNPYPYDVEFALLVRNPRHIERSVHRSLSYDGLRVTRKKEWFRCSVETAIFKIKLYSLITIK